MKRVLTVVLTLVLALSLAVTAYAGELVIGGKEAGVNVTCEDGVVNDNEVYIKAGSLDFRDGSFQFHLTDLKIGFKPSALDGATDTTGIALNLGYGKWYAKTGGDDFALTLSNAKGDWVPYLGYMKTASSIDKDLKFLAAAKGTVAGINVGFNAFDSSTNATDMNVTASTAFDNITVAGFAGGFTEGGTHTNYYGGDVVVSNVIAEAKLSAGVYANTGDGLAYMFNVAGVKAGSVTLEATYKMGNDNVDTLGSGDWKDGNIPGAGTKEFYTKAELPVDFFGFASTVTGEYTRYLNEQTNKFKLTDKITLTEVVKDVTLTAEFGDKLAKNKYEAVATVVPVAGLEVFPKVTNEVGDPVQFETAAQYTVDSTVLRGGLRYKSELLRYFVYGDSTSTYGTLDTQLAGMYYKKDIDTAASTHTRAYAKATTNLNEYLTDVGVRFLYKKDNDAATTTAVFGGKYAVSADTTLGLNYLFTDTPDVNNHAFVELAKTVGSATFKLSYGAGDGLKTDDNDTEIHHPSFKEWIKQDNIPWRPLLAFTKPNQNTIKASVTVAF